MKLAYLILAHDNPGHLSRLINALSEEWTWFFIHVDQKTDINSFLHIRSIPRATLIDKRVPVFWGGFSQIRAVLNLLTTAREANTQFEWFALLSGADYPIRTNAELCSYLINNSHLEHMNIVKMPCLEAGKPLSRLWTYRIEGDLGDRSIQSLMIRATNRIIERCYRRNYRYLLGAMRPYAGSTWWILSKSAVEYVADFVSKNDKIVDFFKHTVCPDEMFFQTILGNSPFKDRIGRNLTYTDWSAGGARPGYITSRHLSLFEASDFQLSGCYGTGKCFFARKFGTSNYHLLDRLDAIRNSASRIIDDEIEYAR